MNRDLAKIYQCKNDTKEINQAVKRNIARFPEIFYFQLTLEEYFNIYSRSQIVTLNKNNNKRENNLKYLSYDFNKQGIASYISNTYLNRFIIIDKDIVFHCGTSLNKAGGKTFAINKIEENDMKAILINNVLKKV